MSEQTKPPEPPTRSGAPIVGCTLEVANDVLGFPQTILQEHGQMGFAKMMSGRMLIVPTPEPAREILFDKREAFEKVDSFTTGFGNSLVAVDGEEWSAQRDVMGEFFYPDRINSYAENMVGIADRRIDEWDDGERLPLLDEMQTVALAVLFETIFEREVDLHGEDKHLLSATRGLNGWFEPLTYLTPNWVPTPGMVKFYRSSRRLNKEADRLLDDADPSNDDLLSVCKRVAEDSEYELDRQTLRDNVRTLLFAGTDTTALSMTYSLHELHNHPQVLEDLLYEIESVVGDRKPTLDDLPDLELLERVLNETLRMYPPAYNVMRKSSREVQIGDYTIPENEEIAITLAGLHQDPDFWGDDAMEWKPSRWADYDATDLGCRFMPFSAGPRICIGRRMARLEARLVIARILQRCRMEPLSELELAPKATSHPADDVPVRVEHRDS